MDNENKFTLAFVAGFFLGGVVLFTGMYFGGSIRTINEQNVNQVMKDYNVQKKVNFTVAYSPEVEDTVSTMSYGFNESENKASTQDAFKVVLVNDEDAYNSIYRILKRISR